MLCAVTITAFLSAHGTQTKTDHFLGHKNDLNQFLKIEITQSMFSNHNGIKLKIKAERENDKNL